ncbi:nephrocystin-1 isoform X1 [Gadus morhua]|uniref:nephrocystin-1 isoform X1 n=1 Tax=Gadus morhua TaxID=8049 RepID=UPI0011B36F0C|nr:nephrocystin-1 isoform X1 [Gadus morhua]
MAPKRKGLESLALIRREADVITTQVDLLAKDVPGCGNSQDVRLRCQNLRSLAEKTLSALNNLSKVEGSGPVEDYDQRREEECLRVRGLMERLDGLALQLSTPAPGQDDSQEEDSEEDDEEGDEDDEDDDEEDDEEDDASVESSEPRAYSVLSDIRGEEPGDLSVQRGELLRVISTAPDGWWLAEDSKGNRGLVPRTYLKSVVPDENESEEGSDEEPGPSASESHRSKVRKTLTEVDVLSAMGAIPPGFTPSTLNRLALEGVTYRGSRFIQPELSQSQLAFKDIFMEPNTGEVRGRQVAVCVCFSLVGCRRISPPGVGVAVLSRHVRLCAFDGSQVLSNIHTVRATVNPKNPKTWTFSARVSGDLPTLLDGECFLRCSSDSPELGLLLELGVTFTRTSTGEKGELSCGWTYLKLSDTTARTYELPVHGGTPFESQLPVQTGSKSMFQVLQSRSQPKLTLKLKSVSRRTRAQLSLLPDCLLYCSNVLHLLLIFRQILTQTLMGRPTAQSRDLMCHPVLTCFPLLLDETDLLDAFKSAWHHAEQAMSRALKRDLVFLRAEFTSVFLATVHPLLHSTTLPCQRWADLPLEEQRVRLISLALDRFRTGSQSEGPVAEQEAFDVTELSFDPLGKVPHNTTP